MYRILVLDIPLDGETIRILIDTKLHSGILWVQFCNAEKCLKEHKEEQN